MKKFWLLLCAMVLLPLCAHAVVTLPEGMTTVEEEAFANTGIDALIVPASVQAVGANVLAGCNASYIYLESASTVLESGANNDVPFVFAPFGSSASGFSGFYETEFLVLEDGLYYGLSDTALPLCAQNPSALSGSVTIPKFIYGVPIVSLEELYLSNTGITELRLPSYLAVPEDLSAIVTRYQTMTVHAPEAEASQSPAGRYLTWTVSVDGAYGAAEYLWTFDVNGDTYSAITDKPTVQFAPMEMGSCTASVTVVDELGDEASSPVSEAVAVTDFERTYRALLVGNLYPGETRPLPGCDNDVAALKSMLQSMAGTRYQVTATLNQNADGIRSAIASAFADAHPGDISLFYYSGHGHTDGSLVGTGNTLLTVYSLRAALQAIPGTKIVILDCCYSGRAIGRSVSDEPLNPADFNSAVISAFASVSRSADNLADEGFIVLTACRGDQQSVTVTDWMQGLYFGAFTYSLCYGSGYDEWERTYLGSLPADANSDAAITLGEAYSAAKVRIAFLNEMMGGALTQAIQSYGSSDFVLWQK